MNDNHNQDNDDDFDDNIGVKALCILCRNKNRLLPLLNQERKRGGKSNILHMNKFGVQAHPVAFF